VIQVHEYVKTFLNNNW